VTAKHKLPETLEDRYAMVCDRIATAAKSAGRKASDVILVAVTKNAEPEQIRGLLQLGHRDFGENRAQVLVQHAAIVEEFLSRQRMLPNARRTGLDDDGHLFDAGRAELKPVVGAPQLKGGVRWHMIGHLQRNKAKKVTEFVRLIHSVDSLRLAEELQAIANKRDQIIEVLLQVNCSGEEQKFGCPMPAAIPLAEQIGTMINVRLRGLMTMAAIGDTPSDASGAFGRCRELFDEMKDLRLSEAPFDILSMGMSGDYEVGIEHGANVVRVGSAIFGEHKEARPDELPEDDE
jgi:pyridoxal phosphate enzyme (YggS family)